MGALHASVGCGHVLGRGAAAAIADRSKPGDRDWSAAAWQTGRGGARSNGPATASHVTGSGPVDTKDAGTVPDDGWRGALVNTSGRDVTLTVHAVCR